MSVQMLTQYFTQYGAIFVFVIVLLEYMNLPGFPAGVIMPLAGIWAAKGAISFPMVMLISVAAGLLGSWILYFFGRLGGDAFFRFYVKKFPKQKGLIEKNMETLRKRGAVGVFLGKLVPMIRTLISIPAGMISMDFGRYTISSALGVLVWNTVFIGAGYFMGDAAFQVFA
ncbi:DedA family protein [Lachnospiraceae bacterium WCA-9-b2]|uniref:DedA family protein n=1 Tax=Sporofaciens musculi TaxID=2681861 RepID=A0A7X3MGT9_9FIRM|nr:DedA family protein [Sporofaciens musculi]MCI9422903.1 DedA family protein [Dorea sp.]MXP76200.1 DedA family protein [Sporofaciens musculi]